MLGRGSPDPYVLADPGYGLRRIAASRWKLFSTVSILRSISSGIHLLYPFHRNTHQRGAHQVGSFALHQLQHLLSVATIARDCDRGNQRALPQLLIIDLRHGYIEFAAQPVFQALDGMALILKRVGIL